MVPLLAEKQKQDSGLFGDIRKKRKLRSSQEIHEVENDDDEQDEEAR